MLLLLWYCCCFLWRYFCGHVFVMMCPVVFDVVVVVLLSSDG